MKTTPSIQHLLNLISDVDQRLKMTWLSEGLISLNVQQYLYQWVQRNDVTSLEPFGQCMIESFRLAAVRGFSGYPEDTERSIRSLAVNIQYYRGRIEARRKTLCCQKSPLDDRDHEAMPAHLLLMDIL